MSTYSPVHPWRRAAAQLCRRAGGLQVYMRTCITSNVYLEITLPWSFKKEYVVAAVFIIYRPSGSGGGNGTDAPSHIPTYAQVIDQKHVPVSLSLIHI